MTVNITPQIFNSECLKGSTICQIERRSVSTTCYNRFSSLVGMEQRWFGGWKDLDCSTPRVQWLHTPLHRKAEAQETRPSKPEKKGTCLIGNSRGLAARVWMLLSGSGKALDTFLCPLHESGLVKGERM